MYSPPYNRVEKRAEVVEFMRANSFPILVTGAGGVLHASHLPVLIFEKENQIVIDMHMAKNNPQWKEFFDDEVLVVFSGPHAYVSPRWYEEEERIYVHARDPYHRVDVVDSSRHVRVSVNGEVVAETGRPDRMAATAWASPAPRPA